MEEHVLAQVSTRVTPVAAQLSKWYSKQDGIHADVCAGIVAC